MKNIYEDTYLKVLTEQQELKQIDNQLLIYENQIKKLDKLCKLSDNLFIQQVYPKYSKLSIQQQNIIYENIINEGLWDKVKSIGLKFIPQWVKTCFTKAKEFFASFIDLFSALANLFKFAILHKNDQVPKQNELITQSIELIMEEDKKNAQQLKNLVKNLNEKSNIITSKYQFLAKLSKTPNEWGEYIVNTFIMPIIKTINGGSIWDAISGTLSKIKDWVKNTVKSYFKKLINSFLAFFGFNKNNQEKHKNDKDIKQIQKKNIEDKQAENTLDIKINNQLNNKQINQTIDKELQILGKTLNNIIKQNAIKCVSVYGTTPGNYYLGQQVQSQQDLIFENTTLKFHNNQNTIICEEIDNTTNEVIFECKNKLNRKQIIIQGTTGAIIGGISGVVLVPLIIIILILIIKGINKLLSIIIAAVLNLILTALPLPGINTLIAKFLGKTTEQTAGKTGESFIINGGANAAQNAAAKIVTKGAAKTAAKSIAKGAAKTAAKSITKGAAKTAAKSITKGAAKTAAKSIAKGAAKTAAKKITASAITASAKAKALGIAATSIGVGTILGSLTQTQTQKLQQQLIEYKDAPKNEIKSKLKEIRFQKAKTAEQKKLRSAKIALLQQYLKNNKKNS